MVKYIPGKYKPQIRKLVLEYLIKNKCSHVLTLPNIYFDLEEKLLEHGLLVDSVERDSAVFNKQVEIAPEAVSLHHKTLGAMELLKYDGFFLDLCGTFSLDLDKALKKIKKGSAVIITLLAARESHKLQKHIVPSNRVKSYELLLKKYNLVVDFYVSYNVSSPMLVFFCRKT